ncbi:DUF58 domain-containing protein [Peribacillus sp. SCS-26]|uniref:DUF58 domain-containing protein n=1 Tax=Paraperibacillus marinus TaxID=3115295 RepID=UPI00390588A3
MKQKPIIEHVYLFGSGAVMTTVPLAIFCALYFPIPMLLFVFSLYYVLVILLKLYNTYVLDKVHFVDDPKKIRMFPGEGANLAFTISNRGKLPIPQAKINFTISRSLVLNDSGKEGGELNHLSQYLSLPPGKAVSWGREVTALHRGIYYIQDAEVILYDLFNLSSIHYPPVHRLRQELLVYPEIKPVAGIEEINKITQGSTAASFSLHKDELSIAGVKKYEAEGFRQIHWKASARSGELISKKYQPVIQKGFTLCLYLTAPASYYFHANMEDFISYTAFLCKFLSGKKIPYELFINISSQGEPIQIHLNEGSRHFLHCLETLAMISEEGQLLTQEYFNQFVSSKRASDNITIWIGEHSANRQGGYVRTVTKDGLLIGGGKHALSAV